MSTLDQLAAIPDVEGVRLYRVPPLDVCGELGSLAVAVGYVTGAVGLKGRGEWGSGLVNVACDKAHDLSWQGPEVYVWPEAGDIRGVIRWSVCALGFIEAEAREAFNAVRAVIDRPLRRPG